MANDRRAFGEHRESGVRRPVWFVAAVVLLVGCVENDFGGETADTMEQSLGCNNAQAWIAPVVPPCIFDDPGTGCSTEWGSLGVCLNDGGYLYCASIGSCADGINGNPCFTEWGDSGRCTSVANGVPFCLTVRRPAELISLEDAGTPDSDSAHSGNTYDAGDAQDAGVHLSVNQQEGDLNE